VLCWEEVVGFFVGAVLRAFDDRAQQKALVTEDRMAPEGWLIEWYKERLIGWYSRMSVARDCRFCNDGCDLVGLVAGEADGSMLVIIRELLVGEEGTFVGARVGESVVVGSEQAKRLMRLDR
jgi:hypothetical protein